jgi:hypothetical protein
MRNRLRRTLAITLALTLVPTAGALAGALGGKTYEGGAPSSGVNSEGHRVRTHAGGNIVLRVAGNGRSLTVRFSSSAPVLYCNTQQRIHVQTTRAASISSHATFRATVSERFSAGPGPPAIVQVISGHFSGRGVHGAIRTQAGECGGIAGFSATAR